MKKLMILLSAGGLASCMQAPPISTSEAPREVLTVHDDGRMEYRERLMHEDDVIIYGDGFGGERAAVRINVPLKENDFFRDSIRVEREEASTVTQN